MAQETETPLIPEGLTKKQWQFANEYVKCFSATKAAKATGEYKNDQSASNAGWAMLHRPLVQKAISDLLSERNALWAQEHWRIIQEALTLGLSNIGDFVRCSGDDVTFTDWDDIPHHKLAAVQGMTKRTFKNGTVELEIKMQPKARGVEMLMKNLGMLSGKSEEKTNRGSFAAWSKDVKRQAAEAEKLEDLEKQLDAAKAELMELKGQSNGEGDGASARDTQAHGRGG